MSDRRERRLVRLSFAVIYLVWGVSYAVGRILATSLPPLLAAGVRFVLAGVLITVVVYARGRSLPRQARAWRLAAVAALLGVVIGNGLNMLALRYVPSNQVALISASCAFWIAWLGMYGRQPSAVNMRTWVGLAVGFVGVAILVSAHGLAPGAQLPWQLAVLGAALAWALATFVIRESQDESDPVAFTAAYLLIGGPILTGIGIAHGDGAHWSWSPAGLASIAFLAVFSSTLSFIAYSYLLRHETPARIGTYAYVNPLVAVLAGWLLLGERLTPIQWLGAAVIFVGVVLVRNLPLLPAPAARAGDDAATKSDFHGHDAGVASTTVSQRSGSPPPGNNLGGRVSQAGRK
jgi:drug/metabolite transporter (DMT)-like permease